MNRVHILTSNYKVSTRTMTYEWVCTKSTTCKCDDGSESKKGTNLYHNKLANRPDHPHCCSPWNFSRKVNSYV